MPTVLREGGYHFIMFSSDHPPAHVHVRREGKLAKVALDTLAFERDGGFNKGEQSKIIEIIRAHLDWLLSEWTRLYPSEEGDSHE